MNKIPFLSFNKLHESIRDNVLDAIAQVYDSYWYINGPAVSAFEKEYAAFNRVEHCVGVANGLDAIFLSLKALGIGAGDEVIIPSNTYIATALAVSECGAIPVFAEPDVRTYNLDPRKIEALISSRTKALIPVHMYGQACQMEEILDIANAHKLYVVEDNAQSHGALCNEKLVGSFGDVNATSFYPGKNLGAIGDAGAVTTNRADLADTIRKMRNYGSSKKYYNEIQGYNMRLDELQAAVLNEKLKHLRLWNNERQVLADRYNKQLENVGDVILPYTYPECSHVYHLYVIRTRHRDELQQYLANHGIETLIHYPVPIFMQEAYKHFRKDRAKYPIACALSREVLSLPLYIGLDEEVQDRIVYTIKNYFSSHA